MSFYRVLNTRPVHQANSLTQLIEKKGGYVFNLPVFEIQSVQFYDQNLDDFDDIIFLSANAVEHYFQRARTLPHAFPLVTEKTECASHASVPSHINQKQKAHIIAIGPATKSALEKQGVHTVICPSQFNSEGILLLPEIQSIKNKKVAIICGEHSKTLLPDALKKRGAEIISIICYRRHPVAYDMNLVFKTITDGNINCIVSTSLESYFALLLLFTNPLHRAWLLKKTICVISDEMKQQAITDGFSYVIQADNATNEAIVRAI